MKIGDADVKSASPVFYGSIVVDGMMLFSELEEFLGIPVGNFGDDFIADKVNLGSGQQSLFDVVADEVAECASEILMTRIRKE